MKWIEDKSKFFKVARRVQLAHKPFTTSLKDVAERWEKWKQGKRLYNKERCGLDDLKREGLGETHKLPPSPPHKLPKEQVQIIAKTTTK